MNNERKFINLIDISDYLKIFQELPMGFLSSKFSSSTITKAVKYFSSNHLFKLPVNSCSICSHPFSLKASNINKHSFLFMIMLTH